MSEFTTGEAREHFAEVINRAAYGKDRVILTRRGKQQAAIRERLRRLGETPGHGESLAGLARVFVRRWPAPDEDWDEAVARAAGEDFLRSAEELPGDPAP